MNISMVQWNAMIIITSATFIPLTPSFFRLILNFLKFKIKSSLLITRYDTDNCWLY